MPATQIVSASLPPSAAFAAAQAPDVCAGQEGCAPLHLGSGILAYCESDRGEGWRGEHERVMACRRGSVRHVRERTRKGAYVRGSRCERVDARERKRARVEARKRSGVRCVRERRLGARERRCECEAADARERKHTREVACDA